MRTTYHHIVQATPTTSQATLDDYIKARQHCGHRLAEQGSRRRRERRAMKRAGLASWLVSSLCLAALAASVIN